MKPNYKNWVPQSMVVGMAAGSAACLGLAAAAGSKSRIPNRNLRRAVSGTMLLAGVGLAAGAAWMEVLHNTFDYNGKRQLAKTIVEGTAEYVTLPDGGTGLDVGCGSGALTIACAKRNPNARMVGCDIWSGAYKTVFTKKRCEQNAEAEGVTNVRFKEGNAIRLPFADESFDAVTSNYVYHNITGKDKKQLLLETLRVLKKGGTFAIHDLMDTAHYGGHMDRFVQELRDQGYEEVQLINTTDGRFMDRKEAVLLGLAGSTLLVGIK